jgi:hypothetical protein
MRSLTNFLPELAPFFGLTEQALYERQRALVRLGLLQAPKGRGRGSGAQATPETVACLIVAALVTDNLSDTDKRVEKLAFAPCVGKSDRCPWTGGKTFLEALTMLLSEDSPIRPWPKSGAHTSVCVFRNELAARITFVWSRRPGEGISEFGRRERIERNSRVEVEAHMPFEVLRSIRGQLFLEKTDEITTGQP